MPNCAAVPLSRLPEASLRRIRPRQVAGFQLQAARVLPVARRPPYVEDRGAFGRPRHPARAGEAVGAVAADRAALVAGRAARAGHAGAALVRLVHRVVTRHLKNRAGLRADDGRGCVKTRDAEVFGGPSTLGSRSIVAYRAICEVDIELDDDSPRFSHSLGQGAPWR